MNDPDPALPTYDDIEDAAHNTTRFLIMEPEARPPSAGSSATITSFVFEVRSVPARQRSVAGAALRDRPVRGQPAPVSYGQ